MRRLTSIAAAIGAVFAVGSAQALVIQIDDFNTPFSSVFDTVGGDLVAASAANAVGAGNLATARTISNLVTTAATSNLSGGLSAIGTGPSPNFFPAALNVSNASGINSINQVDWTLPASVIPAGPASFSFSVVFADNGAAGNTTLSFTIGATPLTTILIPNTLVATDYSFALSAVQTALLAAGGLLNMTVTGSNSYDISFDTISLVIPEPTSLALVGLALLGAGVVSRRRKA